MQNQIKELRKFSKDFMADRFMGVVGSVFDGEPRTFICWYIYIDGKIYWKSRVASEHSRAFAENPKASMCVYDSASEYPNKKVGIQLLGKVSKVTDRVEMQKILDVFSLKSGPEVLMKNNIEELCKQDTISTFYRFSPQKFKLVCKDMDVHMENYEEF